MSTSTSSADSLLTPSGLRVSRRELLLLLTSTLRSLGCERAVAALTDEGGVSGSYVRVESLLEHVREGRWAAARRKLNGLRIRALSTQQRRRLRLLLFAANFMEELQRDISQHAPPVKALQLLQRRIQPLHQQLQRVNGTFSSSSPPASSFPSPSSSSSSSSLFSWSAVVSAALGDASVNVSVVDRLSCVLLLSDVSALQEHSGWDSTGRSRRALAERIAAWMPQEAAVAPHRLLELIDVALRVSSSAACPLHQPASASVASLFQRQHHRCSISAPSSSLAELLGHSDEVLHVRWSNSRRMLASVSKDQTCIVWKEREENASASSSASFVLQRVLRGHPAPLWMVEWSSDDAMLLCCGSSSDVSVWWVNSGDLRLRCDSGHREPVHSAAFVLGDRAFVTASSDRWVVMRDLQGAELMRWPVELLTDLHVTADQRILLASSHNGTLEAIDVHSRQHRIAHILPLHAHAHAHAHTHQSIAAFDLASDGSRALITATKPPVRSLPSTHTEATALATAAASTVCCAHIRHHSARRACCVVCVFQPPVYVCACVRVRASVSDPGAAVV